MTPTPHNHTLILHGNLCCIAEETDFQTLLSKLTPKQREEFQQALESGMIGNWLDVWEPWWTQPPSNV